LVLAVGGVLWTQHVTHGAYLYDIGLLADETHWIKALDMMTRPLTSTTLWVVALVIVGRALPREGRAALLPPAAYALAGLLVAGATGTHPGSSWNYLLDFYAGLAVLTAAAVARLRIDSPRTQVLAAAALCGHLLFALWYTPHTAAAEIKGLRRWKRDYQTARETLQAPVAAGRKVAVLGDNGTDALLSLGAYDPILYPPQRLKAERDQLLARSLASGALDDVFSGRPLQRWPGPQKEASPDEVP
jgi:hypothetical protein